jgi:hypothetical protein
MALKKTHGQLKLILKLKKLLKHLPLFMQRRITSLRQPLPRMLVTIHRLGEEEKLRAPKSEKEGAAGQTSKSRRFPPSYQFS